MAVLTDNRNTNDFSADVAPEFIVVPVAASTRIYQGALVGIDINGRAVAGTAPSLATRILGRAEDAVNNSTGAAGDRSIRVRQGVFYFANSTGVDAITAADVGRECYVVDDQTVARTPGNGIYARAGIVINVDASLGGVAVWIGAPVGNFAPVELTFVAGADLSALQFSSVRVNSAGQIVAAAAGEFGIGILQNAPTNGAVGIVRVAGVSLMKADATGVTRGDRVSSAANGLGRASVAQASGLAHVNTSDAGAATDPVIGASVLGIALTTAAASANFYLLLTHSGAVATTAI